MEAENNPPIAPPVKKRRWLRRILTILLLIFIGIQFIQPDKDNQNMDMTNDIREVVPVPDSVYALLKTACYDCHSNYTTYPWYSNIQPVGWWLKDHIDEGKSSLNFQEFTLVKANEKYPTVAARQDHKLEEVAEMVKEGEMPLKSYTITHGDARLTEAQKLMLANWVVSARAALRQSPAAAPAQ